MKNRSDVNWDVHGLCIGVPKRADYGAFKQLISDVLPYYGCNTLVLLIRYRYAFQRHPEVTDPGALTPRQAAEIAELCRANDIRLIPKMNLLGHQSGTDRGSELGLLRAYPEFDETPDLETVRYCRSLCPSHPAVTDVVFDLMDEILMAFDADALHVGLDEVFEIGHCPRCKDTPNAVLFADWVRALHRHLAVDRNAEMWMWGDRLLDAETMGYGEWESSANHTWERIDEIPRDIVMCDWHYEEGETFPSVPYFAEQGFPVVACPWRYVAHTQQFLDDAASYAAGKDSASNKVLGVLQTSWCDAGALARYLLGDDSIEGVARLVGESFRVAMEYGR